MVDFAQVQAAREALGDAVRETPVFSSTQLGNRLGIQLWLKAESFQRTGSFKVRGALNFMRNTPRSALEQGVITISAGNHAQGVAWAAREAGVPCTVVMLASPSPAKVAATEAYGAEVIIPGGTAADGFARLAELQRERNLLLVHPFDDPLVIAGQGTIGLEMLDQVPDLDVVVCPIGGGGLISGLALAIKSVKPSARVYGVEPEGAAAMRRSWDRDEVVHLDSISTVADGLSAPMAGQLTYPMTRAYVDDIVTINDEEIIAGLREMLVWTKLYVEPAGAAATAALLAGKIPVQPGETVVSLVSGANLDLDTLKRIL